MAFKKLTAKISEMSTNEARAIAIEYGKAFGKECHAVLSGATIVTALKTLFIDFPKEEARGEARGQIINEVREGKKILTRRLNLVSASVNNVEKTMEDFETKMGDVEIKIGDLHLKIEEELGKM